MDSLVDRKQKESYYGPDIHDSYPPLFLATEADTAEAACHQKARHQQHTELGRWLQTQAAPALAKQELRALEHSSSSHCGILDSIVLFTTTFPLIQDSSNNQE